jgi:phosphate starvation-inducible protein PhoH and related proteins
MMHLYDLMGFDRTQKMFEKQVIEIAPLAYMRGRTLNHAFIILDEAQNTTPEQMKMFLTRIGFGSKAVVTGDVTQIDLQRGQQSGLIDANNVLASVRGIAFTRFTSADVVRHPLVGRIVDAYETAQASGISPTRDAGKK